jgi:hypothetical protein
MGKAENQVKNTDRGVSDGVASSQWFANDENIEKNPDDRKEVAIKIQQDTQHKRRRKDEKRSIRILNSTEINGSARSK